MSSVLINIDVPDIRKAVRFYTEAFGLVEGRRLGEDFVELLGFPSPIYLLGTKVGSKPFAGASDLRDFHRHWTPVHLDIVVDSIQDAAKRAIAAGAMPEGDVKSEPYGKLALFSDPFGNGFCLLQFTGAGYDEIAE